MIKENEIFAIGKIIKALRVGGELLFDCPCEIFDNEYFKYFILDIDGIFVPFFIDEYKIISEKSVIVKIDGIYNQNEAKFLAGKTVFAPIKFLNKVKAEESGIEYFINFQIFDKNYGFLGKIADIDQTTANILMVVQSENREILIPFVESYIIDIDHDTKIINVNLPQGLIEL